MKNRWLYDYRTNNTKNRILWTYIFNLKTIQFHFAVESKKHRKYSQIQQLFIPVLIQQQISASQAIIKLINYINIYVQSHREI
jgi:hypothetical protein